MAEMQSEDRKTVYMRLRTEKQTGGRYFGRTNHNDSIGKDGFCRRTEDVKGKP